jgi:BirA family biotin operon repressor/biotin-[acetyl-CoA-carboxylase] ligase
MDGGRGLRVDLVDRALPTGWALRYAATVGSTQNVARAAARAGARDRTIFVAESQAAGRGRQGRRWVAAPGSGLTFSILFRSEDSRPTPRRYTTAVSLALTDAIRAIVPSLEPCLKWPNDVMLDKRKVAGVLAEADSSGNALQVIVGVGVNVNADHDELSQIGPTATSLLAAAGRPVPREDLLVAFVDRLEHWLVQSTASAYVAWEAQLWGIGQRLRYADGDLNGDVVVLGVDEDGRLRVRLADGSERLTLTGELIL